MLSLKLSLDMTMQKHHPLRLHVRSSTPWLFLVQLALIFFFSPITSTPASSYTASASTRLYSYNWLLIA